LANALYHPLKKLIELQNQNEPDDQR
jgi:hypothetical protein